MNKGTAPFEHREQRLLRVQAILGLVEHDRRVGIDHLVGHFVAAVRRQAMHEQGVLSRVRHQFSVDLERHEDFVALCGFRLLSH